jgi:peptide/nickel transport system substrate-binding protein
LSWLGMDPAVMEVMLHSRNIGTGWNFTHFRSAELDELLDAANLEMDPDARCDLFRQAQQLVMDENIVIPMYLQEQVVSHSARIKDMQMSPHGDYIVWYDAYKE